MGDAAASHDPLSSRGIVTALAAGLAAARAIRAWRDGRVDALGAYAASVEEDYRQYRVQQRAYYALERRWSPSSFWRSRALAAV